MAGSAFSPGSERSGRPPREVEPGVWLFPPNPRTHGGSAWLLATTAGDVLVDCPPESQATFAFLEARAERPGGWMVLLGRDGHGSCRRLQERLGWPVLVQEQEAYLLPGVRDLTVFREDHQLAEGLRLLWTPGPSPGAAVLHACGGVAGAVDGLFCGRLLVPVAPQRLAPLLSPRGFHGPRQRRSVAHLARWLPPGSPGWIASGAALGALEGEVLVRAGATQMEELAGVCGRGPEGLLRPGEGRGG
ncbi:MAG: MBL fold metallo-hydrolase [Cyanobacteriota bacterium]|nr:MBL fold metallo-hydrolase [Cyanobacteriota bacterium]